MQLSPLFLILAASLGTLGVGQALLPTAHAQPVNAVQVLPEGYRVLIQSLHTKSTPGGLEITGQLVNTGTQILTYTSVETVINDRLGQEIGRGSGYLVTGPLLPGQETEFRACSPKTPGFTSVALKLREAGHTVIVETMPIKKIALPTRTKIGSLSGNRIPPGTEPGPPSRS